MQRFRGTVESPRARSGGSAVVVPGAVVEALGGNVRARVKGTLNGAPFASNLMRYGGVVWLGVHKATIQAAGVAHGDPVTVEMELDEAPRVVEVPEALERALSKDRASRQACDSLAFTHPKEFAQGTSEA